MTSAPLNQRCVGLAPWALQLSRAGLRVVRSTMSWDEAFAQHYEDWSASMTADVAFYVELARETNGPLVELGVGNGRVAIPVAEATGRRVVGIDSSAAMLRLARVRAATAGVELDLREGDMRDLPSMSRRR